MYNRDTTLFVILFPARYFVLLLLIVIESVIILLNYVDLSHSLPSWFQRNVYSWDNCYGRMYVIILFVALEI